MSEIQGIIGLNLFKISDLTFHSKFESVCVSETLTEKIYEFQSKEHH